MASETSKSKTQVIVWALVGSLLVILLAVGLRSLFHEKVPVRVATPDYQDMTTVVSTNGKVEPVHDFVSHAPYPAVVKKVLVSQGDEVKAGTLMVALDSAGAAARVASAKSALVGAEASADAIRKGGTQEERQNLSGEVDRARLSLQQAQKDLAALEQLQAKGAASASEVAATRERVATAQSNLQTLEQRQTNRYSPLDRSRVQAQIAESRAAIADAQRGVTDANVRAPFAGTVYSLPVRQYDFVNAGEVLAAVADLHHMQVRAYFDEPEIGKLALNQSVSITWEARPNKAWHGHVVQVPSTVITYGTRNVGECIIAVDDATGDLLPSTNVNVKVVTQEKPHVLAIPREGLRTQGAHDYVFRVVDGKLVRTPVKVGALNLTLVEILDGLKPGDVIALNSTTSADLQAGLSVKAVK
ncbi:MAG: efflux RND transporter periplasmic adaptor subunit [Acidobacteria bacterium]|nr:efflux RND transporter periplasmic adaptor subunit [Acidobacteriota bacterium]